MNLGYLTKDYLHLLQNFT